MTSFPIWCFYPSRNRYSPVVGTAFFSSLSMDINLDNYVHGRKAGRRMRCHRSNRNDWQNEQNYVVSDTLSRSRYESLIGGKMTVSRSRFCRLFITLQKNFERFRFYNFKTCILSTFDDLYDACATMNISFLFFKRIRIIRLQKVIKNNDRSTR